MTAIAGGAAVKAQKAFIRDNPPPPAKPDTWLIAKTSVFEPYPCYCEDKKHWKNTLPMYCDCYGRPDFENLKHFCCALRELEGAIRPEVKK